MSIKFRITFGFALILVLVLIMFFMADRSSQQSQENVEDYAESAELVECISDMDQHVLRLQKYVLIFSSNGHASSVRQALAIKSEMEDTYKRLEQFPQVARHQERYRKICDLHQQYFDTFERAIEDRNKREEYLGLLLQVGGTVIPELFAPLLASEENVDTNTKQIHQLFMSADQHAMRFVLTPDSINVNATRAALSKATGLLQDREDCEVLIKRVAEYQEHFLQLVHATRGYLFLFNVVMAGQINEMTRQSQELRSAIMSEQEREVIQFRGEAHALRTTNMVIAVLSLLVGFAASILIGRSIARPINDMTMTFTKLAKGDDSAEVQVENAAEEITSMAAAARVFKEKNQETKELLQKTLAAEDQLKVANAELEQFAYVASHDLQEPLRMVTSYVQLLGEEYADKIDAEGHEFIGFASEGAKRMQTLINDLLSLSRVGRSETEREQCDLNEVFSIVRHQAEHRMKDIDCVITSDDLPTLNVYRNQVIQVFQNFLTNALKYKTPDKGLTFHAGVEESESEWVISFSDNGIGIDPAHFDKIFKIFQRLHTRREYEGSGMGLAIVKKIAEQHQGRVWVESQPGQGATFYFSIGKAHA